MRQREKRGIKRDPARKTSLRCGSHLGRGDGVYVVTQQRWANMKIRECD